MPTVYHDGDTIPEFGGSVRGAITVVVHRPEEVAGLRALCALAGQPPESPLAAVAKALEGRKLDLNAWLRWRSRLSREENIPEVDLDANGHLSFGTRRLEAALHLVQQVWEAQGQQAKLLYLAMAIPSLTAPSGAGVELVGESAGLVLFDGSLRLSIIKGAFRVVGWAVLLGLARGTAPSRRRSSSASACGGCCPARC